MHQDPKRDYIFEPDQKTAEVYDVYKRVSAIYRRSIVAMGRSPKYKTTMSNTKAIRVGDERE